MNYYNEIDPKAAATLRELIKECLIAPGDVDERSIEDVKPADLMGYTQCHFFAGYGIWSLAFRLAGWPDSRPVWSGSCPCQPFSAAGKGGGFADERHLWPAWFHLVQHAKRPGVPVYGEQVASPDGLAWLDLVWSDLEAENHTVRPFDLCCAGFGAPIIRQRTFWVASATTERYERRWAGDGRDAARIESERLRAVGGLGGSIVEGLAQCIGDGRVPSGQVGAYEGKALERAGVHACGLAWADGRDASAEGLQRSGQHGLIASDSGTCDEYRGAGPTNGFWRHADWLRCRDDKWRPVEPGTFPLAHGYPERVGLLRGAGNAISPEVAAYFIKAHLESEERGIEC